jgi:hypothetical protein
MREQMENSGTPVVYSRGVSLRRERMENNGIPAGYSGRATLRRKHATRLLKAVTMKPES